jgi:hypothetical protein
VSSRKLPIFPLIQQTTATSPQLLGPQPPAAGPPLPLAADLWPRQGSQWNHQRLWMRRKDVCVAICHQQHKNKESRVFKNHLKCDFNHFKSNIQKLIFNQIKIAKIEIDFKSNQIKSFVFPN